MVSVSNEQQSSYSVQKHPQRDGWAIVTVRDTAIQQADGTWLCNEFTRDVPYTPDLTERVANNPQEWLDNLRSSDPAYQARMKSDAQIAALTEQLNVLRNALADANL